MFEGKVTFKTLVIAAMKLVYYSERGSVVPYTRKEIWAKINGKEDCFDRYGVFWPEDDEFVVSRITSCVKNYYIFWNQQKEAAKKTGNKSKCTCIFLLLYMFSGIFHRYFMCSKIILA